MASHVYVVFDGDKDVWAYRFLRGWDKNENVNFEFEDAHDLDNMTARARGEAYVKGNLRARMEKSQSVMALVGESTKDLFKFIRWELDLALELGKPLIVANLNNKRGIDRDRCPPIIAGECAVHIPFKLAIIKHALDTWPRGLRALNGEERARGPRHYNADIYTKLGL
jgi:hypothetical protein